MTPRSHLLFGAFYSYIKLAVVGHFPSGVKYTHTLIKRDIHKEREKHTVRDTHTLRGIHTERETETLRDTHRHTN